MSFGDRPWDGPQARWGRVGNGTLHSQLPLQINTSNSNLNRNWTMKNTLPLRIGTRKQGGWKQSKLVCLVLNIQDDLLLSSLMASLYKYFSGGCFWWLTNLLPLRAEGRHFPLSFMALPLEGRLMPMGYLSPIGEPGPEDPAHFSSKTQTDFMRNWQNEHCINKPTSLDAIFFVASQNSEA